MITFTTSFVFTIWKSAGEDSDLYFELPALNFYSKFIISRI